MQQSVGVGECRTQRNAARRGVDHTADRLHATRLVVHRAVVEQQLHVGHVLERFGDRAVAACEVEQLVLGHREVDVHGRVVRDGGQRLRHRGAHQCTHTVGKRSHDAVRRSLDNRIGEVVGGIDLLCLGLCELCFGRQQVVLGRGEVVLRNDVAGEKFFFAVIGQLCRGDAGFGSGDIGFGGLQSGLVGHLVDDEQRLSFRHALAFVDAELPDRSRNLRVDVDVLTSADRCGVVRRNFPVGCGDGQHGVFAGAHCRRGLSACDGSQAACPNGRFHDCLLHNFPFLLY